MSLIITTYAPEGIILAGDSRLTLNWNQENNGINNNYSITASDSNNKVFQIKEKFGLATFGAADINGIPISGYINQFIEEKIKTDTEIDEIPQSLHEFFGDYLAKPETCFYLCGYKLENGISIPHIYFIDIHHGITTRLNYSGGQIQYGANWGGETEVMTRLLNDIKIHNGEEWTDVNATNIPFNFFTLQDAIDFSIYAVRTTIETFKFQQRIKTVGGPIDILAIKPNEVQWIRKKELSATNPI
ncbi:hypothetical protein NLM59_07415 [Weeksellaceae bacterium KMM 9724]|uniref:hypothetical protein n=1 Tax=Profundicola chukchiensis TaxID=2961959 RepID=UPI00243E8410|nr:hypothetical protein [Profundicola chukchiensis]MDG4950749.1 hypothetical protein [Profundicola chukchiensis]